MEYLKVDRLEVLMDAIVVAEMAEKLVGSKVGGSAYISAEKMAVMMASFWVVMKGT